MKKVLSMFLVLAMMLSLVSVASVASTAEQVTTGTLLTDASQLATAGEYYMTGDVEYTGTDAITIADGVVLYGNGYTLKTAVSFAVVAAAKVTFNNVNFDIAQSLIASVNGCEITFTDCNVTGVFETDDTKAAGVGGYIGKLDAASASTIEFTNCTSDATLKAGLQVGGFVGIMDNADTTVKFTNCINRSAVTTTTTSGWGLAGGFVGSIMNGNTLEFQSCTNEGTITSNKNVMGGFVGGAAFGLNVEITINNCHNKGEVIDAKNKGAAGGFTGYLGSGSITCTNCVNSGKITSTVDPQPFVSSCPNTTLINCADTSGDETPTEAPELYFAQNTAPDGDGKQKVRIVALLDSLLYDEIGFIVTSKVNDGPEKTYGTEGKLSVNKAYLSLKNGDEVISVDSVNTDFADENYCKYLCAITFKDVPTTGTVVFTVQTYGIVGGQEILGEAALTLTYIDGELQMPQ